MAGLPCWGRGGDWPTGGLVAGRGVAGYGASRELGRRGLLAGLGGLAVVEAEDYMGGVEEGYDHDDAKEQVGAAGAGDGGLGEVGGS